MSSNNSSPGTPEGGGGDSTPVEIILANWTDRFVAWLIDYIIVSIGLAILFALIAFPFWFVHYGNDMTVDLYSWYFFSK